MGAVAGPYTQLVTSTIENCAKTCDSVAKSGIGITDMVERFSDLVVSKKLSKKTRDALMELMFDAYKAGARECATAIRHFGEVVSRD